VQAAMVIATDVKARIRQEAIEASAARCLR
jgi:hypothetical protein